MSSSELKRGGDGCGLGHEGIRELGIVDSAVSIPVVALDEQEDVL